MIRIPEKRVFIDVVVSILAVASLLAIVGCESAGLEQSAGTEVPMLETRSKASSMDTSSPEPIEAVAEPDYDGSQVSVGVVSNGCTTADSFHIEHAVEDGICRVTVVRQTEDLCRRMPRIVRVEIPWSHPVGCEDLPIEFTNPGLEPEPGLPARRSPKETS